MSIISEGVGNYSRSYTSNQYGFNDKSTDLSCKDHFKLFY